MHLKQELDSILTLQSELDSLDTTIEATRKALSKGTTPLASRLLPELSITGERLRTQADQIYDTLNVQNRFPELKQCSLEFVRILLVLRDLKINIRKRAIGSFFEWDKLDQAVGGRQQSMGKPFAPLALPFDLIQSRNKATPAYEERHHQAKASITYSHQQVQHALWDPREIA